MQALSEDLKQQKAAQTMHMSKKHSEGQRSPPEQAKRGPRLPLRPKPHQQKQQPHIASERYLQQPTRLGQQQQQQQLSATLSAQNHAPADQENTAHPDDGQSTNTRHMPGIASPAGKATPFRLAEHAGPSFLNQDSFQAAAGAATAAGLFASAAYDDQHDNSLHVEHTQSAVQGPLHYQQPGYLDMFEQGRQLPSDLSRQAASTQLGEHHCKPVCA